MKHATLGWILVVMIGMTALTATPAVASYPGANGRLFFGSTDAKGNSDVYSVNPDGTDLKRLTTNKSFDVCATVSAQSDKVAFCSNRGATTASPGFQIWVMNADGSAEQQVTHVGNAVFPDFDPTGRSIAFSGSTTESSRSDIWVTDLDGTTLTRLTQHQGKNYYPAYSPDGTQIAFESNRSGTLQVWVMNSDGSNPIQLTHARVGVDQVPDWSPDGSKIAYVSDATGDGDVYVMNADGSDQTQLTDTPQIEFGTAWSPDGKQIAFVRDPRNNKTRPIYLMNADGSDPHVLIPHLWGFVPSWAPATP